MTTVSQPSARPTNKLTAAMLAAIIMELARVILSHYLPWAYDPDLWSVLTPLVVLGLGYVVKDADNTP